MTKRRRVAGRYRITRLLGRGGMGEVFLAHDERLQRDVALKLLREGLDAPEAVERLRREARAAANLLHPNVVTVFDQGEEAGDFYIAMEYVQGQTLADVIAGGAAMPLATKLQLLQALCAGLGHAHRRGVIHRDIKPANLMLTPEGVLRILDFGVAKFGPSTLTGENVVGSLRYMAPEQLALQAVDHRCDIFSVGAVAYELLSGRPAFDGGSIDEICDQISNARFAPLEAICPEVPSRVVGIVRQALDHNAERRFQDLRDMSRAIDRAQVDLSEQAASRLAATDAAADRPQPPKRAPSRPEAARPRPGLAAWLQRRGLTGPPADYLWLAGLGSIPLALAWLTGALSDSAIASQSVLAAVCQRAGAQVATIAGYGSRPNWWPCFLVLPLTLLVIRIVARRLFPLTNGDGETSHGLLLRIRGRDHAGALARLREVGMDPRNATGAVAIALAITVVDLWEVMSYYVAALQGHPLGVCPRELDWTVQFLSGEITPLVNASLVVAAYFCQFVLTALAMMLVALLLRHNLFYLRTIYMRHRAARHPDTQHIVLDFDDVERGFGLRALDATFNLQIGVLIIGGAVVMSSRLLNVNSAAPLGIAALFPDAGQVIIAVAWISCFVIVALPSLVRFLPLLFAPVRIGGRKEYLIEFLPPGRTPKLDTQEEVGALAAKFSRGSFWPAGDNRARLLFLVACVVLFFVLAPVPIGQGRYLLLQVAALSLLAALCTTVTFWLMRKATPLG